MLYAAFLLYDVGLIQYELLLLHVRLPFRLWRLNSFDKSQFVRADHAEIVAVALEAALRSHPADAALGGPRQAQVGLVTRVLEDICTLAVQILGQLLFVVLSALVFVESLSCHSSPFLQKLDYYNSGGRPRNRRQ